MSGDTSTKGHVFRKQNLAAGELITGVQMSTKTAVFLDASENWRKR